MVVLGWISFEVICSMMGEFGSYTIISIQKSASLELILLAVYVIFFGIKSILEIVRCLHIGIGLSQMSLVPS